MNAFRLFVFTLVCFCIAGPLEAADLKPETAQAFDHYVQTAEAQMDTELQSGHGFLWIDALPAPDRVNAYAHLRNGEVLLHARAAGFDIPGGMIHDWIGVVFIPNATLDETLPAIQNYDHYAQFYSPAIIRSKLLNHNGNTFTVALRLQRKSLTTITLDVVSHVQYSRLSPSRASSSAHSLRITEVENPGTPEESSGDDHGYLWKLYDYRRFLADTAGVYMQFEVIGLTRNIPAGLRWLIKPFVTRVPRESLNFTLTRARDSVETTLQPGQR